MQESFSSDAGVDKRDQDRIKLGEKSSLYLSYLAYLSPTESILSMQTPSSLPLIKKNKLGEKITNVYNIPNICNGLGF